MKSETDDFSRTTYYHYNAKGYLAAVIAPDGNGVAYTYNADGSLQKVSPATGGASSYTALTTSNISYTYDSRDRLTGITTATTAYGFTYDAYGNMLSVSLGGSTLATYTYKANNGKLASMTYANGTSVEYVYDALDNIAEIRYNEEKTQGECGMRQIILGTDWWTDCDDAVAVRLLCRAVTAGEISLLGVGINACMEHSVASLRAFMEAEGVCGVPYGIDASATDYVGAPPYQKRLAAMHPEYSNGDAEDAVRLYRRLLVCAEGSVELVEIGFLQVVAALLESEGDELSPLSGVELVRQKVSRVWMMAGKWDEEEGLEHNFCHGARACRASEAFCRLCPVPVTFLGWEVGNTVISGSHLEEGDLLRRVLCDHGSQNGRMSWDPMLVLLALIGDEEKAGYRTVRGWASVSAETGKNRFVPDENGRHTYVVKAMPDAYYEREIDRRIG